MNKQQSLHDSQRKLCAGGISNYGGLNTKKSVSLTDNEFQTLSKKNKRKVAHSVALMLAFLSAENENRQLEDLPLADFSRVPERLLLSVRTKSINENLVN